MLQNANVRKRLGKRIWQRRVVCIAFAEIGRALFGFEVSPTLEWATRRGVRAINFPVQRNGTAANTCIIGDGLQGQYFLAALYFTLDHPKDRPSRQKLCFPFGPHPRDMTGQPIRETQAKFILPCLQAFDAFGADGEFDEVHIVGHGFSEQSQYILGFAIVAWVTAGARGEHAQAQLTACSQF